MNPESLLLPQHLEQLTQRSGIASEVITARQYRSIAGPETYSTLKPLGFSRLQARQTPGMLIPVWSTDGHVSPILYVYRPDEPRPGKNGRPCKYELPNGAGLRLDCPPRCRPMLQDPSIILWLTEGQKKGDALASHGVCVVDLLSVWAFKGKNPFGATTFLNDWDYIALQGREVRIVFDSDVMVNPWVRKALDRLKEHLQRKGAHVTAVYLPQEGGKKVGVDDYLLTHTVQDLEGRIEAPRAQPQPAKPIVKMLPEAPNMLARPLMLIKGRAYAATWLWTETTVTEVANKAGEIQQLVPPQVTTARRLFVVRDDGVIFGEDGDQPINELHLQVLLQDASHPDDLVWSAHGVSRYRKGRYQNPVATFHDVATVYDHFMDFRGSLAEQSVMCELSACLSLMTWLADAYTILPYPWTTSPGAGSGKSKWGLCWVKTSYLGYATTMGGTFSALRDLAEAGATLLFDDAELLSTLNEVDPDKRELVLAGNRKGVQIPVKEPLPVGGWRLRWMNAVCPRGFTAIHLPSGPLESRCIVMPLLKTADPQRGNRDPADETRWPVNRRTLIDDLWTLGTSLLPQASGLWQELGDEQELIGRAFEPWRAVMAVARLIERQGEPGLEERIRELMRSYQVQKQGLIPADRVTLILRAVLNLIPDVAGVTDVLRRDPPDLYVQNVRHRARGPAGGGRLRRQARSGREPSQKHRANLAEAAVYQGRQGRGEGMEDDWT
jgi:Domain of unknown function (DUF3854)